MECPAAFSLAAWLAVETTVCEKGDGAISPSAITLFLCPFLV